MEKELVDKAKEDYRLQQLEKGRPLVPREPLKRTADNNWVHVYCALWHAEIKFSNAARFDMVEGIGARTLRYDVVCKLCKTTQGACVSCLQCHANFHVGCAHSNGYTFGFDITPVKSTRRDVVTTVTLNGDTGSMIAGIWCKEHTPPKLGFHSMDEEVKETDMVALQLFARECKQADLTLTGTARKANLVDQSTRTAPQSVLTQTNRRASTITTQTPTTTTKGRQSNAGLVAEETSNEHALPKLERACVRCKIDVSPRWWKAEATSQSPQHIPRVVDAPLAINGTDLNGHGDFEKKPLLENGQIVNRPVDLTMADAPRALSSVPQSQLRIKADVGEIGSSGYMCQKCHWKKVNGVDEEEERERSVSIIPEPQLLPLRSPPVQCYAPPSLSQSALPSWGTQGSLPPLPSNQPPPLPAWHNVGPPPGPSHPPPPHHPHNGIGHGPLHGAPVSHHPPFHAPYHPPNGYPPYSGPAVHSQMPLAPLRGPYPPPPVSGPPALHLNNGSILMNGMHSPRDMPYSPTHPYGRSSESPFTAPPPTVPQYAPIHHGSPAPGRPETPRDALMRDAPPVTSAPTERISTGASASPSLRNLLH